MNIAKMKVAGLVAVLLLVICATVYADPSIKYMSDFDWEINGDGTLSPGYGGQYFDLEYMGLSISGGDLHFGLQTGFDLTGGSGPGASAPYGGQIAGDLFFSLDGGSTWDAAIRFGDRQTDGSVAMTLYTGFTSLYDPDGNLLPVEYLSNPDYSVSNPWALDTTELTGVALDPGAISVNDPSQVWPAKDGSRTHYDGSDFRYDSNPKKSYVLEGSFDLSLISDYSLEDQVTFHWTMECGNDHGNVTTPEPASVAMVSMGLFGVAFGRRRLRKWLR